MERELIVADDWVAAGVRLFEQLQPRTLVLSGGRTPQPFYERLGTLSYDWSQVDCFFTDERCVPPDHLSSNYRMAREALLSKVAVRVHRMHGEECDADGYEHELRAFFGDSPVCFDLAILGVGADGHTASLFPGDPALDERIRLVRRVVAVDYPRITLTYPALNSTRVAAFLVRGSRKRQVVTRLLEGEDMPAARVRAPRILLICDREAAP